MIVASSDGTSKVSDNIDGAPSNESQSSDHANEASHLKDGLW